MQRAIVIDQTHLIEPFFTISTRGEEAKQQITTTAIVSGNSHCQQQTAQSLLLIARKPALPRDGARQRGENERQAVNGRRQGSWMNGGSDESRKTTQGGRAEGESSRETGVYGGGRDGAHPSYLISSGPLGARCITESKKGGRAREGCDKVCLSARLLWLVLGSRRHAFYII